MRVDRAILIIIAALVLGGGLGADDMGTKIGIVDLDQAVGSTNEGKAAREELERKRRAAELELQPMLDRYKELTEEYQKKRVVLSPERLRDMELDITELQNRLELKQKEVQSRLQVDFERLVGPLREKLVEVVSSIGRDEGYALILTRNAPGIMYTREALDITDLIIQKFDAED